MYQLKPEAETMLVVRRVILLAGEPRMLYAPDRRERAKRALRFVPYSALDAFLVAGAEEADVVAAHGLRMIRECADHDVDAPTQAVLNERVRAVLDALSVLDLNRRHAVRMLLPRPAAKMADRDPLWQQAYDDAPDPSDVLDVRAELQPLLEDSDWGKLPDDDDFTDWERQEYRNFTEGAARRRLGLDTRGFLTAEQEAMLARVERITEAWLEGLAD